MKSIVISTDTTRIGGKERQIVEIVKLLNESHIKVIFIALYADRGFSECIKQYVSEYSVITNHRNIIRTIVTFYRIFRNNDVGLVHAFDPLTCAYARFPAKLLGVKLIDGAIRHAGVDKGFDYIFSWTILRLSDYVISNSYAGLQYFHIKKNCSVVYNFVDYRRFTYSNSKKVERSMVMVASFSQYKDQNTFILAAKELIMSNIIDEALLIGDGDTLEHYRQAVLKSGFDSCIRFSGSITTGLEELLSGYAIGVLCSTKKYREGVSNSILEYMGSGLIAVASNVGATKEIIEDGVNGYLFEAESPRSLVDTIIHALSEQDRWEMIRNNAKKTLELKFNLEKNREKLLSIYKYVIEGRN